VRRGKPENERQRRKRRLLGLDRTPIANFGEQVFSTADLNLKEVRMRMKYD